MDILHLVDRFEELLNQSRPSVVYPQRGGR